MRAEGILLVGHQEGWRVFSHGEGEGQHLAGDTGALTTFDISPRQTDSIRGY